MTLEEAAKRFAADLRSVPGIERYGALRLDTLATTGPRPLRAAWGLVRDQLIDRYGAMTVGEFIDQA